MRAHTANELMYRADILDSDGATVLASGVPCGIEDFSGRNEDQAQLSTSVTFHTVTMRAGDAGTLKDSGYIRIEGTIYIVNFRAFPNVPRPNMWVEANCRVERSGN